jgi:hypothetical protein
VNDPHPRNKNWWERFSTSWLWETHVLPKRKEAFPSGRTVSSPGSDTTLTVPSRTEFHTFHFLLHMLQSLWKNSLHVMSHTLYIFTFLCVFGLWKGFFIILFLNFAIQSS